MTRTIRHATCPAACATAVAVVVFGTLGLGACGGTSSDTPTAPSTDGGVGATVVLTGNGAGTSAPRIGLGQRIRFTNNDSRPHQILSTPHGAHTDCPALNEIDLLSPGQSRDSGVLNVRRGCGFHDHLNPDDQRFRGQVLVGFTEADPTPPDPDY